jgi:hypothetical protein
MAFQSVPSARAARACSAAIAAWSAKDPGSRESRAPPRPCRGLRAAGAVPARAVLLGQPHQVALRVDSRLAPRVHEQLQRQQADGFAAAGQQRDDEAREADRLAAQVDAQQPLAAARGVAFVEDEVDRPQHAEQPLAELGFLGHAVRHARRADLALGAHEPLRERRGRDQEGPRDLLRGEAAQRVERERDLRVGRERRMAAREQQPQPVVGERARGREQRLDLLRAIGSRQRRQRAGEGRVAAQPVDRAILRGRDEPTRAGSAARRPGARR